MKVQISVEKYLQVIKSGVKASKIVGLQWEKAEASSYYYKNYRTWGYTSTPAKLYVFLENEEGEISKKNVYNFVLKTLGWKKLSEKRVETLRGFLVGKSLTTNSLMMKAY